MGGRAARIEPRISKDQIKLIKIGHRQLGIDDDEYRDMLMRMCGVSSCTQLTRAQATRVIEHLVSLGFVTRSSGSAAPAPASGHGSGASGSVGTAKRRRPNIPRDGQKVIGLVTPGEHAKIWILSQLIDWRLEDGLERWMERRQGIKKVRTAREAFLVIEGLKKMFENQMKAKYGNGWWDKTYEDGRINRYIKEHAPK